MDNAGDYVKLQVKQFPARSIRDTAEGKYWKRFQAPTTTQQIGIVSHISYSPVYPHDFAVTSSTRVLVYDGRTHTLKKTIARFPDTAYCGEFRADGRLIVAGCESGIVQVFDLASRSILRQFRGHKRPAHVAHFAADKTHVLSGADDATLRWWDLAQGEQLLRLDGHEDYVRAAAASRDGLWASGSYDHTARLWDVRTGAATMSLEHGAPVESVAFFPSGRLLATAGGPSVCVWDVAAGGRLLQRLTNHQKTVTSVDVVDVLDAGGAAGARLVSGALDGHVKVYDLDSFTVSYAYKYPAPVLSVAVAPHLANMTVGLADRSMVVRRHKSALGALSAVGAGGVRLTRKQRAYAPRLTAATYKYFVRGMNEKAAAHDFVVQARRRAGLREFDSLLKQFRYADALNAALQTGRADVVVTVIEELAARSGLAAAMGKRDPESLVPLLRHVCKYIAHPNHARVMLQLANRLLDMYVGMLCASDDLSKLADELRGRVAAEINLQQDLQCLQGSLDLLLNAPYTS